MFVLLKLKIVSLKGLSVMLNQGSETSDVKQTLFFGTTEVAARNFTRDTFSTGLISAKEFLKKKGVVDGTLK